MTEQEEQSEWESKAAESFGDAALEAAYDAKAVRDLSPEEMINYPVDDRTHEEMAAEQRAEILAEQRNEDALYGGGSRWGDENLPF